MPSDLDSLENQPAPSPDLQAVSTPTIIVAAAKQRATNNERRLPWRKQIVLQLICLFILLTVMFPILWVVSMSLDSRNLARPEGLNLIPPEPIDKLLSFEAYRKVLASPTPNAVSFWELARNSILISVFVAFMSVTLGSLAAYAFSRMHFRGRQVLMISILAVLMLPAVASLAPMVALLSKITIGDFNLLRSLPGVALAVTSGTLPFAIWNMKGYFDTIPKELEEAAAVDGANRVQIFIRIIIPLAAPVIAVTAFFGFIAGWTEFFFSWVFLDDPKIFTLGMALNGMVGQYAAQTPWSEFAAFSVLMALPVAVVYLYLQRYIISGLTIGGVKG